MIKLKQYIIKQFRKIFGYCYCCRQYLLYPKRRRMNTAYEEESKNYSCVCQYCYNEQEKYWERMWEEFYG